MSSASPGAERAALAIVFSRTGKSKRARLVPDNALIDEMKLGVGARAGDAARIEDIVARLEERSLCARLDCVSVDTNMGMTPLE